MNSTENGSKISEVRGFLHPLSQAVVAAISASLALYVVEVGFGFGETPGGTPLVWKVVLNAILGVILFLGVGLGFAARRFPWYALLLIPILIRVFMLRPVQGDLYYVALVMGAYTDVLFAVGAAGGVFLARWWQRRTAN
jgi:hypothetical protein